MKYLIVMVGLPGTGKSTVRDKFIGEAGLNTYSYSTDDKIEEKAKEFDSTYSEVFADCIKSATAESNAEVADAIKYGHNVIWDQTNLSIKKRGQILSKFDSSYTKICVYINRPDCVADFTEWKNRLCNRGNEKSIPEYIMKNMEQSYVDPTIDEGFDRVNQFDMYGNMITTIGK